MKIFNTLTAQEEEFVPQGDVVKMYVCGVTPYAECHLGHALSYIVFDMVRRYLEYKGYKVKHVQNFTDIDDKIINRSQQAGVSASELAAKFITAYFADMDRLNVQRAHVYPRATEEIPKIIEVVQGLIDRGHAYESKGDVYFRVKSDADYGKLIRQGLDDLQSGARVEVGVDKEHPLDFALWKAAKPGEPSWDSPWGKGRPGWHIECSAMSMRYLGESIDIHGGGQDLIFPHHENEIAQSEGFTGQKPFVKYWMHNGFVQLGGEKMSKSLGNFVTLKQALDHFSPDAIRLFILSSHYRSPLNFTEEGVAAAEKGVERLRQAVLADAARGKGGAPAGIDVEATRRRFVEAMDRDFNSPQALAVLFDLVRDVNRAMDQGADVQEAQQVLRQLLGVLGFSFQAVEVDLAAKPFIDLLVSLRTEMRKEKQWQLADRVRTSLKELGVVLEDTPQGTVWKHEKPSA